MLLYLLLSTSDDPAEPESFSESVLSDTLQQTEATNQTEPLIQPEDSMQPEAPLIVDVKGAVVSPGVYELQPGARVQDAIQAAGGLLKDAEDRAVNLALKVQDEMSIYVPAAGEAPAIPEQAATSGGDGKININTADETELATLPGIGPSKAAAIIAYRTEQGLFGKPEDLTNVPGIGDKTFENLKESVTVN